MMKLKHFIKQNKHILLTEYNPGYRKQLLVELDAKRKRVDEGIMLDEWIKSEE